MYGDTDLLEVMGLDGLALEVSRNGEALLRMGDPENTGRGWPLREGHLPM